MNPGLQRILLDAADFLRNKQPRSNVTVVGMVIKLSRAEAHGSGEIVIYGPDDDTGTQRRFRAHVSEQDYSDAVIAHRSGRTISVTGDVELRGVQRRLTRISSFAVLRPSRATTTSSSPDQSLKSANRSIPPTVPRFSLAPVQPCPGSGPPLSRS